MVSYTVNEKLKVQSYQLAQRQSLPIECKVNLSLSRIKHWYDQWQGSVYVAFSGGKDSTVLLHLVRSLYKEVPAVFVDTGLEYPEIRQFVKSTDNVICLKPAQSFKQTIDYYGYPLISKSVADAVRRIRSPGCSQRTKDKAMYGDERGSYGKLPIKWRFLLDAPFKISDKCCDVMKMRPVQKYYRQTGRVGIVGTMAADSNKRSAAYLKNGCFVMSKSLPKCTPLAFWKTDDIWEYIKGNNIDYCPIYDTGVKNTGCMFCMFGAHLEGSPNRFELMKKTHPKLYEYCIEKMGLSVPLDFAGIKY